MIPDWAIASVLSGGLTGFAVFIYFFGFYLGNHPDRAILAMRENRHTDEERLKHAAALFEGMDHSFQFPKGFEKCEVDDNGRHMVALYEDGRAICYFCGVVAQKIG